MARIKQAPDNGTSTKACGLLKEVNGYSAQNHSFSPVDLYELYDSQPICNRHIDVRAESQTSTHRWKADVIDVRGCIVYGWTGIYTTYVMPACLTSTDE
jgi:hypothetical protein